MIYGAEHRRATAAGCLNSRRSRATRDRYSRIVTALVRAGQKHLITPRIYDEALLQTLHGLAAGCDPATLLASALLQTLARTPKALTQFLRRNPAWLSEEIASAERTNGPPP